MANWKKVVVSGSSAALSSLTLDTVLDSGSGGTGLNLAAYTGATGGQVIKLKSDKTGLEFGSAAVPDGTLSSSAQIASNISGAFFAPSASFSTRVSANETSISTLTGKTLLSGSAQIASNISGAFFAPSASFSTRVSANETSISTLTGKTLVSGSAQLAAEISGSSGNKLPLTGGTMGGDIAMGTNNITGVGNLVVGGNFSVAGTASFNHSTNLSVADKYILLNSGSTTAGDGGIVIQQDENGIGELIGYDSTTNRFGITGSFDSNTSANFIPDAFLGMVISGSAGQNDPDTNVIAKYKQSGNIFTAANGDIYIYGNA